MREVVPAEVTRRSVSSKMMSLQLARNRRLASWDTQERLGSIQEHEPFEMKALSTEDREDPFFFKLTVFKDPV